MENIIIREMKENELEEVINLVLDVFMKYEAPDYSEEGINSFKEFVLDKEKIKALKILVAEIEGKIVSMIAVRNNTHITLLFTHEDYHRKGIAKRLFETVKNSLEKGMTITVNSSPYAVDVYKKLGFVIEEDEQTVDGIRFTKMKLEIRD